MMYKFTVTPDTAGTRLDHFLVLALSSHYNFSRSDIIRAIKTGAVTVNAIISKPSHLLKSNDVIVINSDGLFSAEEQKKQLPIANQEINFNILYTDEHLIAINKPAGLQVHPSDKERNSTLVNGLLWKFPHIISVGDDKARAGIVHRLDKDTSGVMVIARSQEAFLGLKELFMTRKITKVYTTLVHGHVTPDNGTIDLPLARSMDFRRQKVAQGKIRGISRSAVTDYTLKKRFSDFDLLEVRPKTGRMHQIRVHLSHIGHPIAGDIKYYHRLERKLATKRPERFLLHSSSLSFRLFDKDYSFEAELPDDFKEFLKNCS